MDNFTYSNPIKLLFGKGQIENVAGEILPYGKKVLLVYGREHLKKTGAYQRITALLSEAGISCVDLPGVHPNPRLELVRKGIGICKREKIDFILAAGGGSVCDTAKAISMGARVDYDIWEAYQEFHEIMHGKEVTSPRVLKEAVPLGVVMTKAGTGSDFDYTSVLSNHESKEKLMVINKVMYPKFSIQDPTLTYTLPRYEVACGTADIMTHYLEQYFTVGNDTEILDRTKEAGIKTVIESGARAFRDPSDYTAQGNLLYCAAWACSDQSMTGTLGEWSAHMIEHEITAINDLNHGNGMAVVYIPWMKYVIGRIPEKFARYAEEIWGIERKGRPDIDIGMEGIEKTAAFWQSLEIPLSFKELGIDRSVLAKAARQAVRFGPLGGIVQQLEESDILAILEMAM